MRALSLKAFVRAKSGHLIGRVEERMKAVTESNADAESVHDLRTSIRRLGECLKTFDGVFPGGEAARLRRQLRKLMQLAAEVRNRDVAEDLFAKAGVPKETAVFKRLRFETEECRLALTRKIVDWTETGKPKKWRSMLKAG